MGTLHSSRAHQTAMTGLARGVLALHKGAARALVTQPPQGVESLATIPSGQGHRAFGVPLSGPWWIALEGGQRQGREGEAERRTSRHLAGGGRARQGLRLPRGWRTGGGDHVALSTAPEAGTC